MKAAHSIRTGPAAPSALLALIAAGGPAAPRRALLAAHPDPAAALAAGPDAWHAAGLTPAQGQALRHPDAAAIERALRWLAEPGHHLLGWHDPDYPPLLRDAPGAPLALFVAGDPGRLWVPAVAVVGSRSPTPGGRDNAADFARAFAAAGLGVVSGMAAGIDTAAHAAALTAGGVSVAVLGTGPDVAYPRANADLHAWLADAGAVVSEHWPGSGPRKEHFPSRNRILAGLALGTVVIEAAERSGALITARLAADAGREVFALPGSIHNPMARGCHRLIRDGASLVQSPSEVLVQLADRIRAAAGDLRRQLAAPIHDAVDTAAHPSVTKATHDDVPLPAGTPRNAPTDDSDHQNLWHALGHDPTSMDRLVERTGLTPAVLSSMLLIMELEGRVATQHGRYYRNR